MMHSYTRDFTRKGSYGFTLIELLVVIAIIGILASIILASLSSAREKGRDARRIADLKQIQTALELWFDSNGNEYPDTLASLAPTYMSAVPTDPSTGNGYAYDNLTSASAACSVATGSCTSYALGATLENSGNTILNTDVDGTVGGVNCADPVYCVRP